jgi:ubiquinone/menaquinone biosynthesis C-methylase UbiE
MEFDGLDAMFEEEEEKAEKSKKNYGDSKYWEDRYRKKETSFDWFFEWDRLQQETKEFFSSSDHALVLGCGNSTMSKDMLSSGFPLVVSIDIAPSVIAQLQAKHEKEPRLQWYTMDCTKLTFPDGAFELAVDKGTIDALMCGDNSDDRIAATMKEIFRVLKNGGHFIIVSFGSPSQRFPPMRRDKLKWYVYPPIVIPPPEERPNDTINYVYVFEKRDSPK